MKVHVDSEGRQHVDPNEAARCGVRAFTETCRTADAAEMVRLQDAAIRRLNERPARAEAILRRLTKKPPTWTAFLDACDDAEAFLRDSEVPHGR